MFSLRCLMPALGLFFLSVPRGEYTEVVFIENGKKAGKQAVKK